MAEGTDYEQQIRGLNQIRNTVINATQRLVCYDQVIHNDLSLEGSEYAGLTLEVRDGSTVQTTVEPGYENAAILIVDDDSKPLFVTPITSAQIFTVYIANKQNTRQIIFLKFRLLCY